MQDVASGLRMHWTDLVSVLEWYAPLSVLEQPLQACLLLLPFFTAADSCESEAIAAPEQQWGAGSSLQLWLEGENGGELGAEGSAAELGPAGTGLKRRRQELDQVVAEADARLAGSGIRLVRMEPSSSFEAALCHRGSVLVQCSAVTGAAPSPALPQGVPAAGGAVQHMEEPWQRLMIQVVYHWQYSCWRTYCHGHAVPTAVLCDFVDLWSCHCSLPACHGSAAAAARLPGLARHCAVPLHQPRLRLTPGCQCSTGLPDRG